ncbi:MAG: Acetolactate synthase isozyme 3 large subunit [Candidatus Moanabacter tarae]|uniref:Acetolactate synthase isozyme 3 large subunit n=1 Tax=Candidatus Moanibacter tarae TaxID=2200854 RepID=A0A2Z4AIP7_9BACT|nr:MAG: Acetolactate synthase isozyme 3 large subunit [Candidatus Moanabacter tarae]|tara:strand:- start:12086 stop:13663 length:1578 start_codon:yes stop_codon:yes gene_type:complete
MSKMNGGQVLVESLYRNGIRFIFGIPGAGQYEATDAIYQHSGILYINTRHEQAASFMADGYARASGKVGAALVVPGPGFYNACAGISTAHAVSSPILVITGLPYSHQKGGQKLDRSFLEPLTKWSGNAKSPEEIPGLINSAFHHLKNGRKQPVVVEISANALEMETDFQLLDPEPDVQPVSNPKLLDQAACILANADKPLIWTGGGAVYSDSTQNLQKLAEHLQAPVVTTAGGKGAISDRHPLSLGLAELRYKPLNTWIDSCDVILAVGTGTGFQDRLSRQQVVRIDIDEKEIRRPNHHSLGIEGDASYCLDELLTRIREISESRPNIEEEVKSINELRFNPDDQLQPQHDFQQAIRSAIPDDGILVIGMNQMGYYCRNYYATYSPRTLFTSSSEGTLGSAYPIALGAKVAKPNKAVVSISGDGGFLYNVQELATAVQHGICAVAIVFNDNAFGNVLRAQIEQFDGNIIGTKLHNPDFVRLAETFGARGIRAHNAEELETTLSEALVANKPTLIEVPVGMMDRRY